LFFVFGVVAGALKSNLEIPQPISRFLSLYLLMALGLKGGFALAQSGIHAEVLKSIVVALILAVLVPLLGYAFLRSKISAYDAAAIAATYGSVSAVTFITAAAYLDANGVAYGGHMAAAMAFMESPAIIIAVVMASLVRKQNEKGQTTQGAHGVGAVLKHALTDGAQIVLIGALLVGVISGEAGKAAMAPFSVDLFKGMLAFFLLDMGLLTARNFPPLKSLSPWLIAYAILGPVTHAMLALAFCVFTGLEAGNTALLMVLAASASYIAVPAALRFAIPEANPSLYFGLSLGVTFPINILIGIPAYTEIARRVIVG
jgi:hypothetical protein